MDVLQGEIEALSKELRNSSSARRRRRERRERKREREMAKKNEEGVNQEVDAPVVNGDNEEGVNQEVDAPVVNEEEEEDSSSSDVNEVNQPDLWRPYL